MHTKHMGSILCLTTIPERGSFPGVCGMPSSPPLEKFSLSQQVSSANSIFVRGGALCLLPFSELRLCLVQVFCVLSVTVSAFMCAQLCCVCMMLLPWSLPSNLPFKNECSKDSLSPCGTVVCLCTNYCVLCGSLCKHCGQKSGNLCAARRKSSSARLSNWCWFKHRHWWFIIGIFKHSTIWGKKSFLMIMNSVSCVQQSLR